MIGVNIRSNESVERGLSRLKKVVEDGGILSELKNRRHFEKPCEEKRRKLKAAIRKAKMKDMPEKKSRKRRKTFSQRPRNTDDE